MQAAAFRAQRCARDSRCIAERECAYCGGFYRTRGRVDRRRICSGADGWLHRSLAWGTPVARGNGGAWVARGFSILAGWGGAPPEKGGARREKGRRNKTKRGQ